MTDPSYPDALPAQHRLHWYVLERVLGQGGFGITYLARDTNLDQQVAIKEYLPVDVATRRPDASVRSRTEDQGERYRWGLDRFIREARTLARFDHPNIVRVLSVFEHNNTAYMVMRFEEGENLAALLERRRTLPEDELMRIVLPILDGLELVHNAGFIHRDIKPDNIHIRADGSPVLLDFGSARHSMGHARTVTILVAPGYAPFEQYYSSGENQGPWTDLYSLGATCYRAIAGIAPMDAISRSKGILGSTREILVPAVTIGSGRYSAGLLKAIDRALAFSEKERPQSIAEWRRELADGRMPAARVAPATVGDTARRRRPGRQPRRRRRPRSAGRDLASLGAT
jgi:serine/threonine protein kinase